MGIEYEGDKLEEILRVAKDNNRMLRAMRRSAFWGGIFKLITWGALVIIPLWLYMQYLAPVMQGMMDTMEQIQGTGASAQTQMSGLSEAMQKLRDQFPQYFQGE